MSAELEPKSDRELEATSGLAASAKETEGTAKSKIAKLGQKKSKPSRKDGKSIKHVATLEELTVVLKDAGRKPVIIDIHAHWCGPCLALAPKFQELADKFKGSVISIKVDVDIAPDIVDLYGISQLPTVVVCKNQEVVYERSDSSWDHLDEVYTRFGKVEDKK